MKKIVLFLNECVIVIKKIENVGSLGDKFVIFDQKLKTSSGVWTGYGKNERNESGQNLTTLEKQ